MREENSAELRWDYSSYSRKHVTDSEHDSSEGSGEVFAGCKETKTKWTGDTDLTYKD